MNKKIIESIFENIILNTINKCFYDYKYVRLAFEYCLKWFNSANIF